MTKSKTITVRKDLVDKLIRELRRLAYLIALHPNERNRINKIIDQVENTNE